MWRGPLALQDADDRTASDDDVEVDEQRTRCVGESHARAGSVTLDGSMCSSRRVNYDLAIVSVTSWGLYEVRAQYNLTVGLSLPSFTDVGGSRSVVAPPVRKSAGSGGSSPAALGATVMLTFPRLVTSERGSN